MILKYPTLQDRISWNRKSFLKIPAEGLHHSGYYLVGVAESGFDLYVAFTNEMRNEIWIEKTNKLTRDPIRTTNFVEIIDKEEFNRAHSFFIQQGILDGPQRA